MRKILLAVIPVLLFPFIVSSQVLTGRVLSESGSKASGVTVRFQNKANAITTNADGTFKIMATKLPDTLVFSAVGMESYKVVITEKNIKDPNFEVVLLNKREALSEVVVTAIGTRRSAKKLSYSSVSADGMAGKVSGVEIASDSKSAPIIMRGVSSHKGEEAIATSAYPATTKFYLADTTTIRKGVLARSRIVTAGEVNDFNKWKMWEDYTAGEFKTYSNFWGMNSNNRYSLQVTDKKFNAIMNEEVFLVQKLTNDTVWRAFTDNTGKAELWAGFFKNSSSEANYYITDKAGNKVNEPSEFSKGINLLVVNKSCQVSYEVDIAFVVDATGSMGDEIEFLKLELEDVIRNTMDTYKSLSLRASSVFFRDRGDQYVTRNVGFNEDLLKAINFIKLQSAGGGGDYPEAVDDALAMALDSLQWNKNARTKLLFLVLDAPPHNEAKERIQQLTLKAAAMGVRIIPIACSGTDKTTEFLLRSMALATNGTYTFLTNHSGVGNSHIEPTTDKYQVVLLNSLLQRIIGQTLYAKDCGKEYQQEQQPDTKQPDNILTLKLFPNPTIGRFTIESKKEIKEIYIADFTGKIIMRLAVADKKGRWQVDIGNYPSGTYLVKYITTDNKWGTEKVVLMH